MREALQQKIDKSITLLRKAEALALKYDPQDGFYLAFSGGKDSQALYHIAKLAGVRIKAHMNATSIDPAEVIRFVRSQYPDVEIIAPKQSIYNLAVQKGILPTQNIRWCCAELKETAGAGKVTLIGIRHEESTKRSKRKEVEISHHKFKGDMERFEEWQKEQTAKIIKRMAKKLPKNTNFDEFSINQESTVKCVNGKDSILISPIIEWTVRDVWEFLNEVVKIPHCSLYDNGHRRIGCILCPMCSKREKRRDMKEHPHVVHKWKQAIRDMRRRGGQTDETIEFNRQFEVLTLNHRERNTGVFSESPACDTAGITEEEENEIIENIFDWWISGKSYEKWYADKFLQQKINFEIWNE